MHKHKSERHIIIKRLFKNRNDTPVDGVLDLQNVSAGHVAVPVSIPYTSLERPLQYVPNDTSCDLGMYLIRLDHRDR
jgi:hypothetical protein